MARSVEPHPYLAYKPSSVEWLGDVPEHWEIVQLGRVGVFSKGTGGTKDDEVLDGIPCVRYGDLYTTHKFFINQTRSFVSPEKASAYTPITRGDVLFPNSGETIEEIGKSAVNLMHAQIVCGGDLIIFRPTIPIEPKFAGYALDCPATQTQKSLMGRGITIMHIYSGQLKYLSLPLPPLPEQRAIVRYLDYVDRRVRRYVGAKRKLIRLLEEEKQVVVNRAVTRGLDPNVRLKPSGVEWLGDVPEHWDVRRLKQVCSESALYGANVAATQYQAVGIRFVRTTDIAEDGRLLGKGVFLPPELAEGYGLSDGDILLSRSGTVGRSFLYAAGLHGPCAYAGYLVRFVPSAAILPKYLFFFTKAEAFNAFLRVMAISSTIENVNGEKYANMPLPLPQLPEQRAIVEHLERETARIDAVVQRARRQVELVEEYRTRLIADVVTGKLDVRAAAEQLPDEDDEEGPIDEDGPVLDNEDGQPSEVNG